MQAETQTGGQTDTKETNRDRHKRTCPGTDIQTDRDRIERTDGHTQMQAKIDAWPKIHIQKQTQRQPNKQRDKYTERHKDRQEKLRMSFKEGLRNKGDFYRKETEVKVILENF